MRNFWHFIQYHNAVPLAITIMVMGGGITFAATDPQALYSADQQVVAVDNTYLVNKDLTSYTPTIQITGVTEDTVNYYVAYNLSTIDLGADSVWKDVVKTETMTVSKADLGPYRDLGVYVTQQLKQIVDNEIARLKATQVIEKQNVTQKTVATTYGGLVGKFLNSSTETLPGYTPVVQPPVEETAAAGSTGSSQAGSSSTSNNSGGSGGSSQMIGLQLLGNNPAVIGLNTSYIDLGAALIDPLNTNVGVYVFQNGKEVAAPSVDTSTTSVQVIEYHATDPSGSTIMVRRIVLIGGAQDPGGEISSAGNVNAPTPPPAPVATTTPATTTPPVSTSTSTPPIATSTPPTATTTPDTSATTTTSAPPVATTTPPDASASTTPVATSASSTAATSTAQ
jgi:hypothetical protein